MTRRSILNVDTGNRSLLKLKMIIMDTLTLIIVLIIALVTFSFFLVKVIKLSSKNILSISLLFLFGGVCFCVSSLYYKGQSQKSSAFLKEIVGSTIMLSSVSDTKTTGVFYLVKTDEYRFVEDDLSEIDFSDIETRVSYTVFYNKIKEQYVLKKVRRVYIPRKNPNDYIKGIGL
ncbi:MAG: hypothetical protein ACI9AR_000474 [Flavobacteriaceae bacterium]|jgi:hypothetical protein